MFNIYINFRMAPNMDKMIKDSYLKKYVEVLASKY